MKLKKIASLALAGLMAVGMLAGCSGQPANNGGEGENTGAANLSSDVVTAMKANKSLNDKLDITAGADYTEQLKAFVKKYGDDQKTFTTALLSYTIEYTNNDKTNGKSALNAKFAEVIKADVNKLGGDLIEAVKGTTVGTSKTGAILYAVNASVDNELITDMVADVLVSASENYVPSDDFVTATTAANQGKAQTATTQDMNIKDPVKFSYKVSVATVEDSVDYDYLASTDETVKYVAVVVTVTSSK